MNNPEFSAWLEHSQTRAFIADIRRLRHAAAIELASAVRIGDMPKAIRICGHMDSYDDILNKTFKVTE